MQVIRIHVFDLIARSGSLS